MEGQLIIRNIYIIFIFRYVIRKLKTHVCSYNIRIYTYRIIPALYGIYIKFNLYLYYFYAFLNFIVYDFKHVY